MVAPSNRISLKYALNGIKVVYLKFGEVFQTKSGRLIAFTSVLFR